MLQNKRLTEEINRLQDDINTQQADYDTKIAGLQVNLENKHLELQQVGKQLRAQLAQKSIKKLSEVIGIKTVLTAMNLESESSSEDENNQVDK